jgi:hypothetical protein
VRRILLVMTWWRGCGWRGRVCVGECVCEREREGGRREEGEREREKVREATW